MPERERLRNCDDSGLMVRAAYHHPHMPMYIHGMYHIHDIAYLRSSVSDGVTAEQRQRGARGRRGQRAG